MSKNMFHISEDAELDFDFGFIAASKDDIKVEEFSSKEIEYQKIITNLIKTIDPFLNNLAKDGENKEYIYWPNRKEKIEEFRKKLRKIATIEVTK